MLTIPFVRIDLENLQAWPTWISAVVGGFVVSSPIGYLLYLIFDYAFYTKIARGKENIFFRWNKRSIIKYLNNWINEWAKENTKLQNLSTEEKQELIDFALYTSLKEREGCSSERTFAISDTIIDTLRGFWSHHNARYVCSLFVPLASGILATFLVFLMGHSGSSLFKFDHCTIVLEIIFVLSIFAVSWYNIRPTEKTRREIYALEEYILLTKKNAIHEILSKKEYYQNEIESLE